MKKNRKTLPRTALPRMYYIDREIAAGKYPNTRTLAGEYETGTATISRDIEFMRDRLGAPIEYDYFKKGYYYTKTTYRLPAAFASANELAALGMTKTLLGLYRNTPMYDTARQLLETLTTPLEDTENPAWYEDRIVVPPVPSIDVADETWQTICGGLRENRVLFFQYRASWRDSYRPRRVRPYQLLFDNGAWYLYAWDEERKGTRMFSLARIKNAALRTEKFTLSRHRDFRVRTGGGFFGVYTDDKKRRFRIDFYDDAALRVQERKWAADQIITPIKGGVRLEFSGSQYGKVLELVLSQGRDAEPLEPPELVTEWQTHIRCMAGRIRRKR
jgi:predicted DNA-binding transcriptional regulator YafY